MAKIGARGRGSAGARGALKLKKSGGTGAAAAAAAGPAWKPKKGTSGGNYGKAVSAAAHARNANRKMTAPPSSTSIARVGGGGIRTEPIGPITRVRGSSGPVQIPAIKPGGGIKTTPIGAPIRLSQNTFDLSTATRKRGITSETKKTGARSMPRR